jgi:hypothetical protein
MRNIRKRLRQDGLVSRLRRKAERYKFMVAGKGFDGCQPAVNLMIGKETEIWQI